MVYCLSQQQWDEKVHCIITLEQLQLEMGRSEEAISSINQVLMQKQNT